MASRRRIVLLDELRGLCLLLMVAFHAFYTIGYTFDVSLFRRLFQVFSPAQPWFAGIFIFLCGICCNFSRSNLKRGLLLGGAAVLLSGVVWCAIWWRMLGPGNEIWFGILHLLAVCILLYALLRPALNRLPAWLGVLLCGALFVLCYHIPFDTGGYFGLPGVFTVAVPAAPTDHPLLYPLGLCPISLCGDYFPLLPWVFCFLAGAFAGRWRFPKGSYRSRFTLLGAMGRHSLLIYLLHQPVLYLLCEVAAWVIRQFG